LSFFAAELPAESSSGEHRLPPPITKLFQRQPRFIRLRATGGSQRLCFNGPSGASKAAFEAFADVYRAELRPFGIDFVVAEAGNMRTGGPAKTAANLKKTSDTMSPEQRRLYGKAFDAFAATLNKMQASGLSATAAAAQVIELAEEVPAPIRGAVGEDAEDILRLVREKSDVELDTIRRQLVGLDY
jgi:NAD(P)-dependent dehydrogenase (short-subunit alcohol dehydrogenase family)